MPRNKFSDMTPRKRSIRDIPLHNKPKETKIESEGSERIEILDGHFSRIKNETPGGSKKIVFVVIFLLAGLVWGASIIFHAATVNITPEKAVYTGIIDIQASTEASPGELQYDSLVFSESSSKKVPGTSEEDVSVKASGKVIVYNKYSTTPQKLITNTRFESTDGKIYRIADAVSIPGFTTKNGEKVPGSAEITIHADVAGADSNNAKTDFKIPGFKGTPQYEGFYARSLTDITGGLIGKQKRVDPKLLSDTTEELKKEIISRISESIATKIPADFISLTGAQNIEFVVKSIISDRDMAVVTVEANIRAFVFKKEGLNEALKRSVAGIKSEHMIVHDYSKLSITKYNESSDKKTLNAVLSGDATMYALIDKEALATEMVGIKKSLINTIINQHEEIVGFQVYMRPPWMISLPANPESIHIIEQIDE
jgi:hypothetical protein